MLKNKPTLFSLMVIVVSSAAHAKSIYPAEIMGRSLGVLGLGPFGHVGIATADMLSSKGMLQHATQVIEVLNENPVGQINSIDNFKSRSKYWGSKYGVADRGERGYRVLIEANHQRWWCPRYTQDTNYHIGKGNLKTGAVEECGKWRCDTYVWWAFYSQGWDIMPGRAWFPSVLFHHFPYANDVRSLRLNKDNNKRLDDVSAQALNAMPMEAFQMIIDMTPAMYHIEPQSVSAEMRLAYDKTLNESKRGIMIDRLFSRDTEPDLISKLLKLYQETDSLELRSKIIEGFMFYNQQHRTVNLYINQEQLLLKSFFADLLASKSLPAKNTDLATRGFIDTHSPEEIMNSLDKIDAKLLTVGHYSSIMLKYSLVHQSKALQRIYIASIIDELRAADNSDLDSYLFGPLAIGYQGTGKNLLEPESRQMIIDYLKQVRDKYTIAGIKADPNDIHRQMTAVSYFELIKNMGV